MKLGLQTHLFLLGGLAAACSAEPNFGDDAASSSTGDATSNASAAQGGTAATGQGGEDGSATSTTTTASSSAGGEDGGGATASSGGGGGTGAESGGTGGGSPLCGNGLLDGGETCDDESELCVDCEFTCPADATEAASYPGCYFALDATLNLFDAATACAAERYHGARARLPTPRTEEDLAVLASVGGSGNRWLGAGDFAAEGELAWLDLNTDQDTLFPFSGNSAVWSNGEPNDADGREDCVFETAEASLSDTVCSLTAGVVCEVVPGWAVTNRCGNSAIDPGEECDAPGEIGGVECVGCDLRCSGVGWTESPLDHACFTLAIPGTTWDASRDACAGLGARLATPDDPGDIAVARYICDVATSETCWLGGGREDESAPFAWESGEAFDYVDFTPPWKAGEPGDVGTVLILESGLLDVVDTGGTRGALCEIGDEDQ